MGPTPFPPSTDRDMIRMHWLCWYVIVKNCGHDNGVVGPMGINGTEARMISPCLTAMQPPGQLCEGLLLPLWACVSRRLAMLHMQAPAWSCPVEADESMDWVLQGEWRCGPWQSKRVSRLGFLLVRNYCVHLRPLFCWVKPASWDDYLFVIVHALTCWGQAVCHLWLKPGLCLHEPSIRCVSCRDH